MRRSHSILFILLFGTTVILAACSHDSNAKEDIVQSDNVIVEKNDSEQKEEQSDITKVSKVKEEKKTIGISDGLVDQAIKTDGTLDGTYSNLEVNVKGESNQVLLCKDNTNGIVYYVNYGIDYFIYRIKNGISELVVKLPAKQLFCREGKLYFILDSYGIYEFDDIADGNIMCYQPVTGRVSRITQREVKRMNVYKDGIYYYTEKRLADTGDRNF